MNDLDRRIASLAARQHGLVTRAQLRSGGASPAAVRTRTSAARLHRVAEGVYRVGGAPITWESQVLAAVLAGGPSAVGSHRTAAALWGLDGCRPGRPEVTVPLGRRYRPATARVHQSTDLHLIAPVRRSGIHTTPIEWTLLDLGAVVPPTRVHLALDHALRSGLTTVDRLLGVLARHARRGRRGVGPLRELLAEQAEQDATPDSGFERLIAILLQEAGLPRPTLQHPVTIGGSAYRIDLCYPEARVAIEPDGTIHLRRDVWQSDHERQNALVLAGWTILRFTWHDYRRRPDRIVREVERALTEGS